MVERDSKMLKKHKTGIQAAMEQPFQPNQRVKSTRKSKVSPKAQVR